MSKPVICIELGLTRPSFKRIAVYDSKDAHILHIGLGIVAISIWNQAAKCHLLQAVQGLMHDKSYILSQWPLVRQAARKGYAKGRAQGKAEQYSWKQAYGEQYAANAQLQIENNRLRYAIETLRRLDEKADKQP